LHQLPLICCPVQRRRTLGGRSWAAGRRAALQTQPDQQIKVPACWEHAAKCVTVPLVRSVGKLLPECVVQQASTHKPLFFSLEIRFRVMNSQGFPCFAGQRNPGLTQRMMKGAHHKGHRQALSPEAAASHLAVHQGRVVQSREPSPSARLSM